MNLIIDIGNTAAKIAVFDEDKLIEVVYDSNQSLSKLIELCQRHHPRKGMLASVVELNDRVIKQLKETGLPIHRLTANTPIPIINLYKTPQTLGNDRLAAVIGANAICPNRNLLIIDAGTAITYDFIDAQAEYRGGNIAPGMQMRFKALNQFTNKLPLIDEKGEKLNIGNDTETAIRSGVVKGIEYEIKGYIDHFQEIYPNLLVFLTGGDEFSFDTSIKSIIFADRFLVLKGLNRILNYNGRI